MKPGFQRIYALFPCLSSSAEVHILNHISYDSPFPQMIYMSLSPIRVASNHSYVLWILARQKAACAAAHLEHSSAGWLLAGQREEENIEVILKLLLLLGH